MKKIIFLTGTRADFGKLKSLIEITSLNQQFEVYIFATGMHLSKLHGNTVDEIRKCGYKNIHTYNNHEKSDTMDEILGNTILGFSNYIKQISPDLIVVHGDRVEAMSGAIVGALNNILVAHIEGGEISGTIDELIRHSISKMSHIHFVANDIALKRLVQMGEVEDNIFVIGSPDIDAMLSSKLPSIEQVRERYEIEFENYAISLFHPVTTEFELMKQNATNYVDSLLSLNDNFIVIYPNNDLGYHFILDEYKRLENLTNIKIFPSVRFEYFIVLLKYAKYLIGNSSAGIREAPYYGIPTINIGTRQNKRAIGGEIINCSYEKNQILEAINSAKTVTVKKLDLYGDGNSDQLFLNILLNDDFWEIEKQKQFKEINFIKL